jgi:hypothetical protein
MWLPFVLTRSGRNVGGNDDKHTASLQLTSAASNERFNLVTAVSGSIEALG